MKDPDLAVPVSRSRAPTKLDVSSLPSSDPALAELDVLKAKLAKATAALEAGIAQGKLKNHLGGPHCIVQAAVLTLSILKDEEP